MFDKNGGVQALIQYPGSFIRPIFSSSDVIVILRPWDDKVMTI